MTRGEAVARALVRAASRLSRRHDACKRTGRRDESRRGTQKCVRHKSTGTSYIGLAQPRSRYRRASLNAMSRPKPPFSASQIHNIAADSRSRAF